MKKILDRGYFMNEINAIEEELKGKILKINSLNKEEIALIVIDMVNGFVYNGPLSSPRVAAIVNNVIDINEKTIGCKKVFFTDSHNENSQEFISFPIHCLKNSEESMLIPELLTESTSSNSVIIKKNSTNGFNSEVFRQWLSKNCDSVKNFIVIGCVTDLCVLQFALSLKAYFNEMNKDKRIIVPMNAVDTYDLGSHNAYLMNLFALYNMHISGIEVVDKII